MTSHLSFLPFDLSPSHKLPTKRSLKLQSSTDSRRWHRGDTWCLACKQKQKTKQRRSMGEDLIYGVSAFSF